MVHRSHDIDTIAGQLPHPARNFRQTRVLRGLKLSYGTPLHLLEVNLVSKALPEHLASNSRWHWFCVSNFEKTKFSFVALSVEIGSSLLQF
jgi:hypothetical protein